MDQIIVGGTSNTLSTVDTTVEYNCICGGRTWTSTLECNQLVTISGEFSNLLVKVSAAPGVGDSWVFTFIKNDVATDIVVTISGDAQTEGSDTEHSVAVAAGDTIKLKCETSGTTASSYAKWCVKFSGDTENESLLLGGADSAMEVDEPEWNWIHGTPKEIYL